MQLKLKEIRTKHGDTLQNLARKIDYDYSNLSKVERGIYTPSLELLNKIALVYNIELTDLFDSSDFKQQKYIPLESIGPNNKYNLSLDNEVLSDNELDLFVQNIRIFRNKLKDYK
ncbi:helix-turn-helix domain-containing protein [Bacillus cereus]